MNISENLLRVQENINNALIRAGRKDDVTFIAVTKTVDVQRINEAIKAGAKNLGENRVQELVKKYDIIGNDANFHMIGHLQTNKVKYIASFIHLIHSVDSLKLLLEINNQAKRCNRTIDCLLQVYIAKEETKFGLDTDELDTILSSSVLKDLQNIRITGLMGMATFSDDLNLIRSEFRSLKSIFNQIKSTYFIDNNYFTQISMGMSSDYHIAIEEGSTIVRIGTALFGKRD